MQTELFTAMKIPRRLVFAFALTAATPVRAAQPVPPFPKPPVLPKPQQSGYVGTNGVRIWYGTFGSGPPVVLLEGGLDTTDDWGTWHRLSQRIIIEPSYWILAVMGAARVQVPQSVTASWPVIPRR